MSRTNPLNKLARQSGGTARRDEAFLALAERVEDVARQGLVADRVYRVLARAFLSRQPSGGIELTRVQGPHCCRPAVVDDVLIDMGNASGAWTGQHETLLDLHHARAGHDAVGVHQGAPAVGGDAHLNPAGSLDRRRRAGENDCPGHDCIDPGHGTSPDPMSGDIRKVKENLVRPLGRSGKLARRGAERSRTLVEPLARGRFVADDVCRPIEDLGDVLFRGHAVAPSCPMLLYAPSEELFRDAAGSSRQTRQSR